MQVIIWLMMSGVLLCFLMLSAKVITEKYKDFSAAPFLTKMKWRFYCTLEFIIFFGGGIYLFFKA